MSVQLFKTFSNALRFTLPRLPCDRAALSRIKIRHNTAMSVANTVDESELIPNKNRTRYKKRQWEFYEKRENGGSEAKKSCNGDSEKFERIKRKKMAMLLGYCGVDYHGMQRNPGVSTIEEELLKALLDAKYITDEDFKNQQNAQFQRGSRTDKGVSAARQVVSLKMPLEFEIEELNKRLPKSIRVFGIKRTTNRFNSKTQCNARSYTYTLPTYVFEPSLKTADERKAYRIPAETLGKVNSLLEQYKGTRPYHNFTEKKHYNDPSVKRFMMHFGVQKVFVEHDMEFAELLVKGQSFMLHQIRKMVGLAIAVMRGHTDMVMFEKLFGKDKLITPTAPGLGLVLEMVHYDRYTTRFQVSHESLSWDDVNDVVEKFKHEYIYPVIVRGEIEGNNLGIWLEDRLAQHSYEPTEEDFIQKETEIGGDDDEADDPVGESEIDNVSQVNVSDQDVDETANGSIESGLALKVLDETANHSSEIPESVKADKVLDQSANEKESCKSSIVLDETANQSSESLKAAKVLDAPANESVEGGKGNDKDIPIG